MKKLLIIITCMLALTGCFEKQRELRSLNSERKQIINKIDRVLSDLSQIQNNEIYYTSYNPIFTDAATIAKKGELYAAKAKKDLELNKLRNRLEEIENRIEELKK